MAEKDRNYLVRLNCERVDDLKSTNTKLQESQIQLKTEMIDLGLKVDKLTKAF